MATAATTTRSLSLHAHALPSPTTGTAETLSSLILHLPPVSGARRQGLRAVAFPSKQGCRPKKVLAEAKKGFLLVTDKKNGYSFLYPFG
uniref:Uncharacterized protein n=1 Tax=Oryza nivara TaxID=4536 RepID=A0A0E0G1Y0_ORYNI